MTRATLTALLILILSCPLAARADPADPAFLVKDLNTAQVGAPTELTSFAGRLYFKVSDTHAGPGLWRSDGTAAGTQLVLAGAVSNLTAAQGHLFLTIPSESGLEVWAVDAAGNASRLTTAHVGFGLTDLTVVGSRAFFVIVNLENYSSELWGSDGTVAGTTRLKQFNKRFIDAQRAVPNELTAVGETLFFYSASDGAEYELWKSDGSPAGTVQVAGFALDTPPVSGQLADVDGTLYFVRLEPDGRAALWRSDGSAEGTVRIKIRPSIEQLTTVAGRLFFAGLDDGPGRPIELWTSDGTADGTVRLGNPSSGFAIVELTAVSDRLFFFVDKPDGRALWRSDGTVEGTQPVRPVAGSHAASVGGSLYFNDGALWKSDGTEAGTAPVTLSSLNPMSITDVEGTPFMVADDGSGPEIWKSDGTDAGTVRVADLLHDTLGSYPSDLTDVQGTLLFTAVSPDPDPQYGFGLWRSDGSVAGTRALAGVRVPYGSRLGPVMDGGLYFAGGAGGGSVSLWRSDGTELGTRQVADVGAPFNLTRVGHTLFFYGRDPAHGYELWKSDGSAAGTALVSDINPGPGDSAFRLFGVDPDPSALHSDDSAAARLGYFPPFELAAVGGTLFFGASDGTSNGLWRTDGTAAGTVRLAELASSQLTAVNGTLFFTTDTGGLWKSDGTAAGTVRIAAVDPSGLTSGLTSLDGVLYFFLTGRFAFQPTSLWRTDGSEAGTREVGNAVVSPQSVVVRNGSLFYLGTLVFDNVTRLYRYDAARGIALVRELPRGAGPLTAIYDQLLFGDRAQLWRSDGTESGTTPLQDFAIDDGPAGFTLSGGYVFFAADGGDGLGRELWALPATARCDGDCGRDGVVSVADLVTAVNVALDNAPLATCTAIDLDGSGEVTIDELVLAVGAALEGCTLTVPG